MIKLVRLAVFFLAIVVVSYLFLPSFSGKTVEVTIPRGSSSKQIAHLLADRGVIANSPFFLLVIAVMGYDQKLKAGVYEFRNPTIVSVLDILRTGKVKRSKVMIAEGLPVWQTGEILAQEGVVDLVDFNDAVKEVHAFHSRFAWFPEAQSVEGYLFPDTYYFDLDRDATQILRQFLARFKSIVIPMYDASDTRQFFTLHEVITLASIVEKEARVEGERPIIAAVFRNRLERDMKLSADPTVNYALGDFDLKLDRGALADISPYNTYVHHGLPPGPICSPGADSIRAVLSPADVDYLFFVARGDGTHEFSRTYAEHLRAIERYRKG